MKFKIDFSERLKIKIKVLNRSDRPLVKKLLKKMQEISSRDQDTIEFYKNLRAPMQDYKRVHIDPFILTFKIYKAQNLILFDDFDHHDNIYQ